MGGLINLFILLMVGAVGYPLLNEETTSPCHALEKRFVMEATRGKPQNIDSAIAMGLIGQILTGNLASTVVKSEYPNIPPPIGCTIMYYRIMQNPNIATSIR